LIGLRARLIWVNTLLAEKRICDIGDLDEVNALERAIGEVDRGIAAKA